MRVDDPGKLVVLLATIAAGTLLLATGKITEAAGVGIITYALGYLTGNGRVARAGGRPVPAIGRARHLARDTDEALEAERSGPLEAGALEHQLEQLEHRAEAAEAAEATGWAPFEYRPGLEAAPPPPAGWAPWAMPARCARCGAAAAPGAASCRVCGAGR